MKAAVVAEDGRIEAQTSFDTATAPSGAAWLDAVAAALERLGLNPSSLKDEIEGIGIGVPGFVDFERGFVHDLTNVPGWKAVWLNRLVEERFGIPARADNDVNAMALGESTFGAGRHYRHAVFVTVGTGVGGALLINGQLYRGAHSMAGEIGHLSIDLNGPTSPEGRGGLEQYVGNRRLIARTVSLIREGRASILCELVEGNLDALTPRIIAQAARQGDALSREIFEFAADCLATAFASTAYLIQPEAFIVGGGVARSGEVLFEPLRARLRQRLSPHFADRIVVKPAQLGHNAGVVGAAILAFQSHPAPEATPTEQPH
ncbi:MAG: ROK family protein [Candidatus Riflebacteria bacterium]|nr:ROK family protein [Candidatus Riflebacteria bacterium]